MVVHSKFGGSSCSRWMACAGSVALCATVPERPSSSYAAEGTAAHRLAEMCLTRDEHPITHLGETIEGFEVTQEMSDAVVCYLNAVSHEMAQSKTAELYVEQGFALDVPAAPGDVFGTNDAMVYHPSTGRLRVFDYKHGQGVSVSADDNAQLKFYAAGAIFSHPEWPISQVVLTIVQPRAFDADTAGEIKDWSFDVVDLLEFVGDVNQAVARAKAEPAPLVPGAHCRWCDAAPVCPARERQILETAKLDFADMTTITAASLPEPKSLDTDRLGAILVAGEMLQGWMDQVRDYVQSLVLSGQPVAGWKAVEKIGRAKWVAAEGDIAGYAALMFDIPEDQFRPRKLTTIGEAEKLLKAAGASKEDIDAFKISFTIKESSGLTLAPASDRRPAVDAIATDFASVQPVTV